MPWVDDMLNTWVWEGLLEAWRRQVCFESMEFSRPEYWSGQPFPSPGDLPNPGIEPRSPALQVDSLPAEPQGKPFGPLRGLKFERPNTELQFVCSLFICSLSKYFLSAYCMPGLTVHHGKENKQLWLFRRIHLSSPVEVLRTQVTGTR